jgi:hypothetical protein
MALFYRLLLMVRLYCDVTPVIHLVQVCLYEVDYTRRRAERYRIDV